MHIKQKAWQYDGSTWSETEFPLPDEMAEWDDGLKEAGYRVPASIQLQRVSYCVSVHEFIKEPGRFLILMTTSGSLFPVIADGFPALLTVLNQMIPVIQMGGETQEKFRQADLA